MKKVFIFSFLVMFLMTAFSIDVDAQYSKKRKKKKKTTTERNSEYFDESGGDILTRLWYGADVNLNFGASNGVSVFTWGISPMVGYKITDDFSVGPKISFANTIQKLGQANGSDLTLNVLDLGGGIFTRHKVLTNYFVHAEYEVISEDRPDESTGFIRVDAENKIITDRSFRSHYYLGAGYGAGSGGLSFTTYALWDFSREFSSQSIPLVVRFGLVYNF